MSTTFGIHREGKKIELIDDELYEYDDYDFLEVAFRGNGTGIRWVNELAPFLPPETLVYPLDNSAQGIYTIGDIINEMKNDL